MMLKGLVLTHSRTEEISQSIEGAVGATHHWTSGSGGSTSCPRSTRWSDNTRAARAQRRAASNKTEDGVTMQAKIRRRLSPRGKFRQAVFNKEWLGQS